MPRGCFLTVHRHLVDLRGVVLLDVPEDADVIVLHEINGHALSAVPARPPNSSGREQNHLSEYGKGDGSDSIKSEANE